jgi:hypothetical protein
MQGYRFGRPTTPDRIAARLNAPEAYRHGDHPASLAG